MSEQDPDYFDQLVASGVSDEDIAREREAVAALVEPAVIWPENWTTLCIFTLLTWQKVVYPGRDPAEKTRLYPSGVETPEIESLMRLHRVPESDWLDTLYNLRDMINVSLPILQQAISSG